ncbi:TRAP transporter small permease [Mesorhizobium sp.]|uniref:TRAP transporter small permease n=1 Tax=Mesorhizobium sp. TaxID=1871066 RepID=UPI000FEAB372|nr:TRAP transporter small permease [Mesorhizobium sp.]RWI88934.1 MAG: TRAP transporter small permease [Mesorhizobium sp.]
MDRTPPPSLVAPSKGAAGASPYAKRALWLQVCLSKVGTGVDIVTLGIGGLCLAMVFVTLLLQVIYRYVLFLPLNWSEEAARFGLVWLGMLSAVIAARRGLHFTFRFVVLYLPDPVRKWLRFGANLLIIFFLGELVMQGRVYLSIVENQVAPATGMNMAVPYSSIVVGSVLMIIIYAIEALDALLSSVSGVRYSDIEAEEQTTYEQLRSWRNKKQLAKVGREPVADRDDEEGK